MNKKNENFVTNLQPIRNSVDKIEQLLLENPDCNFVCVTEHWKSISQLESVGINKFQLAASFCRDENKHGGCAIYCKKGIKYICLNNISKFSNVSAFECSAIEAIVDENKIIIVSLYRPSGGLLKVFLDKFQMIITEIVDKNKYIFIAGDFNIELKDDNVLKFKFLALTNSYDIYKVIDEYTRILRKSKNDIDNILTNYKGSYRTNVIEIHISDHTAQLIKFKLNNHRPTKKHTKDFLLRIT